MQEMFKQLLQQFINGTKFGASVWTTFRFVSNLLFFLCWIVALPVEMILNRRMGRRYIGILPLLCSLLVMVGLFYFVAPAITRAEVAANAAAAQGATPTPTPARRASSRPSSVESDKSMSTDLIYQGSFRAVFLVLVLLAWYRHRLANWWRFQTDKQVHSFSYGVPAYLMYPGGEPELTTGGARSLVPLATGSSRFDEPDHRSWPDRVEILQTQTFTAFALDILGYSKSLLRQFGREWKSGEVPTGPVMWIAATIIHPILVVGCVAGALMPVSPVLAVYWMFAAVAIILKARIQKAIVVEAVYDLFDARLEQEFASALSNPHRLRSVERRGFTVPGLARALVTLPGAVERTPVSPPAQSPQPSADNHTIEPKVSVGVKPDGGLSTVVTDQPSPADVRPASRPVRTIEPKPSGQSAGDRSGNDVDPGSSSHAGPFN